MNYLGSKQLETKRLLLKTQTMNEQKRLWEILMIPEVNKYYLNVSTKLREKLLDWDIQEKFYKKEMEYANDKDIFKWSIFLKDTEECIGRISCQESYDENSSVREPNIRDVGWYIDPFYQGKGYGTEAAIAMIDYMFNEVGIEKIITGAAIINKPSWKIMERLGFTRQDKTFMVQYTFLDELTEDYSYILNKDKWLSLKRKL